MPCNKMSINKNYQCDKAGCVCIPTDGRSCICVCEDENGDIMRCDDCTCNGSGNCRCKCDDSKCTCIVTKGAKCICICRDGRGNIKTCDCACSEATARCCKESLKSCECCKEKPKNEACGGNCECDRQRGHKELHREGRGTKTCDRCCVETKDARCCKKEVTFKSCECCNKGTEKQACGGNCKCDGKKDFKEPRRAVAFSKNYKCDKAECVCLPTGGKSCICVCENDNGDIVRCDDCRCNGSGNCQCKCDDSKCTCIMTKGADCICVCRDKRGNIRVCDCACTEAKDTGCCKKELTFKSSECCSKVPEKQTCSGNCKSGGKRNFNESRRAVAHSKNYNCDQAGYVCLPTGGKSCICVCEDEDGDIMRCDDCKCNSSGNCQCKCDDSKCTCIVTKGADCICVGFDRRGNIKTKDCCFSGPNETGCCKKEATRKTCGCCNKESNKPTYGQNCKCGGKRDFRKSRRAVTLSKGYKCDKAGYICLPTSEKSCICVCENEDGDIMRCNDCKCTDSGNCQCKCDDSKCTCILTKGADCICVGLDRRGNIKTKDCCFIDPNETGCCKKEVTRKYYGCCSKELDRETCGKNCRCCNVKIPEKSCECCNVDNKEAYKSCCSPKKEQLASACCAKKDNGFKTCGNTRALEFQGRRLNEKPRECCSYDRVQEDKTDNRHGCDCVSRETRNRRVTSDDCACVAKKTINSCACRY